MKEGAARLSRFDLFLEAGAAGTNERNQAASSFLFEKEGKEKQESTFKLDPFAKPKAADLTPLSGPHKGATLPGIYALEGDTMKLCLALEERRPTELATQHGRKETLLVLKRDK